MLSAKWGPFVICLALTVFTNAVEQLVTNFTKKFADDLVT